jgi:predicted HTH domain antitoxin
MRLVIPDEILHTTRLTAAELIQELAVALFQREPQAAWKMSRGSIRSP